jgi:hypothetical protein
MGDYEPGNAFWQTRAEQSLARRNKWALLKWVSLRATIQRKPPATASEVVERGTRANIA